MQGNVYRPNVVRIGSEAAPVSARARDVWVDGLIARYMDMDTTTWTHRSLPSPGVTDMGEGGRGAEARDGGSGSGG